MHQETIEQTEEQLEVNIASYLSRHMHVDRQVWSDCRKCRIDIVAECKLTATRFGIEVKRNDKKRGEEMAEFVKQGCRYSQTTFHGSPIPIFLAPCLSNNYFALVEERVTINGVEYIRDRHKPDHEHHTMNGFISELMNVGELRSFKQPRFSFMAFMFSNKEIYSFKPAWDDRLKRWSDTEIKGLHKENYSLLMQKIKSWKLW